MGVEPKNRGTPKWMVKIMENPNKMDHLGGKPTILGNTHMVEGGSVPPEWFRRLMNLTLPGPSFEAFLKQG